MSKTLINIKPSARMNAKFKSKFPNAEYYGNTSLGSKGKSYLLPSDEYEQRKDEVKVYGSRSKSQPFINN